MPSEQAHQLSGCGRFAASSYPCNERLPAVLLEGDGQRKAIARLIDAHPVSTRDAVKRRDVQRLVDLCEPNRIRLQDVGMAVAVGVMHFSQNASKIVAGVVAPVHRRRG